MLLLIRYPITNLQCRSGEYVEYMTDAKHKEYAFLQRKCLDPMQDKHMPTKPSAAFKRGMKAAELEQQDVDEVTDVSALGISVAYSLLF